MVPTVANFGPGPLRQGLLKRLRALASESTRPPDGPENGTPTTMTPWPPEFAAVMMHSPRPRSSLEPEGQTRGRPSPPEPEPEPSSPPLLVVLGSQADMELTFDSAITRSTNGAVPAAPSKTMTCAARCVRPEASWTCSLSLTITTWPSAELLIGLTIDESRP